MHEAWFADEDKVRKTVGLLKKPVVQFPHSREVSFIHVRKLEFAVLQVTGLFLSSCVGIPS